VYYLYDKGRKKMNTERIGPYYYAVAPDVTGVRIRRGTSVRVEMQDGDTGNTSELVWVTVQSVTSEFISGRIQTLPKCIKATLDEEIWFHRRNIIEVYFAQGAKKR